MFNSNIKEKAVTALKKSTVAYNHALKNVGVESELLLEKRIYASRYLIVSIENYINKLANTPKKFSKEFTEIRAEFSNFKHYLVNLQEEAKRAEYIAGGTTGAGVLMGVGVGVLGPTAAVAIATTFGTASTGTAIAALSGAAASNAALAWLGGGALVAGGGGVAAGNALLLLAGPVGWGIGAVAMIGGGLWFRGKNEDIAKEASARRIEIEGYCMERKAMAKAIQSLASITQNETDGIKGLLSNLKANGVTDYQQFESSQKDMLHALVNHTHVLGQLLKKLPEGATQS